MRDLLSIMDDTPTRATTGPRDLLAIMGDRPILPDYGLDNKPDYWNEVLKPSLIETGKQIFEIPKSLGEVAATAGTGALGWLVGSGLGIAEATRPGSTRESVMATTEDAAGRLTYQPRTQPAAVLMEKAGRGIEALTGPAGEAAALVGESWNSPFLESVLKFAGEMATFEAAGAAGKAKAPQAPLWYRKMTVKERGLVEDIKADLASGELTGAEIRELWKDPANREALLKRYQGVGNEQQPGPTMRASGAEVQGELPTGQGFEMRPRPGEIRDILAEMGEEGPKALPPGQGFEPGTQRARDILADMGEQPPALPYPEGVGEGFRSRPGEVEAPIVTKAGKPFKTEQSAEQAGKGLDWNLYEVTPAEDGGFQISRKQGQEIRTPNEPKMDEATRLRAQFDAEQEARRNAPPVVQAETLPIQTAKAAAPPETVQPWADLPYDYQKAGAILFRPVSTWTPEETAFVVDSGGAARFMAEKKKAKTAAAVPEEIVTAVAKPSPAKGPQNLVTYLQAAGKVRLGNFKDMTGDAWSRFHGIKAKDRSREMGDIASVSSDKGKWALDEAAANLNDEGFRSPDGQPWTDSSLFDALASGKARNIFTPDKQDVMIDRQLRSAENEWIERQLENESEIDPRAIQEGQGNLQSGLVDEIKAEGVNIHDEEAALKEASDFFDEVAGKKPGGVSEGGGFTGAGFELDEQGVYRNSLGVPYRGERPPLPEKLKEYPPEPPGQFARPSDEIGPEPPHAPRLPEHRRVIAAVKDRPWNWTADDLMDLKPSERAAKLDKIWGPEEDFQKWADGEGPDSIRHRAAYDWAADLEQAIVDGNKADVESFLKDIQGRLKPEDYYAYEEIQNSRGNASVPGDANKAIPGAVPEADRTGTPAVPSRRYQESLPGIAGGESVALAPSPGAVGRYPAASSRIPSAEQQSLFEKRKKYFQENGTLEGFSESETFDLVNPETEIARGPLSKKDMTPTGEMFGKPKGPVGSERGSTGPINESEILSAILSAKGNIETAMPHLEALGRSVYEGGKQKFLDWQAHMKTKLGDLWTAFKGHMRAIWNRLQSGEIGPLQNQKGAVGLDINKGPVIKQREIPAKEKGEEPRLAPPVYKSEFDAIKKMPELRVKPLGGWIENPIRTFEELGADIKELFYRPIKEGEHLAKKHFQQIHEKAEKIRKALPRGSSERIGIYAISQQKGGGEILTAMGVKEVPKLTPEEIKAYGWMRTGLETFYNKLQEARKNAGKEGFGHVENYFTFARQFALLEKLGFSPIFARGELLQTIMHKKTTPFRYEKHRVGGLTRADLDAFGVFNRYMESATRHYYLSPAIAKGREMLLTFHEGKGKWILRDEKPGAAKFITEWLDYQAGQRKPQLPNLIEKGLTKLNKNLAFSILSANLRSALIQPSAIVNTVTEIGPKWTFEGIKSMLDASSVEKSNVLLSRQFDVNVTETLAGLPGRLGKAKQAVGNAGMKPLQWLDMQTAKATWQGAYKKGKSDGLSENAARNYADDTVTKTQGSAMPSDMAPIQRTALGKSLSMFQTFVINQWGFLTRDVLGLKNASIKNPQAIKKTLTFIVAATAVNSFYEDILGLPSPLPSPISAFVDALDKGEDMPSASAEAAREIASLVPVIGGGIRYGSSPFGAAVEYGGDIIKKIAPNYAGPTRSAGELVAKGLGIPGTAQAVKSIRIANKGGSPIDVILGRYPEDNGKLVQPKTLKGLKGGLR